MTGPLREQNSLSCSVYNSITFKIQCESDFGGYQLSVSLRLQIPTLIGILTIAQRFTNADHWFTWMHMPSFILRLRNPSRRGTIQPSLVLSALAYSILSQSSEDHLGAAGRAKAAALRDAAQSAFESSINAQWFCPTLAETAWVCLS